MPATTIKLPAELKERIAALIAGSGKTMHAFLLDAVEHQTRLAELRGQFVAAAMTAREETLRTGKAFPASQVHGYLRARVKGRKAARPKARSWRK